MEATTAAALTISFARIHSRTLMNSEIRVSGKRRAYYNVLRFRDSRRSMALRTNYANFYFYSEIILISLTQNLIVNL